LYNWFNRKKFFTFILMNPKIGTDYRRNILLDVELI
jgi:hypothetical protein